MNNKVIFLLIFFAVGVSIVYIINTQKEDKLPVINPIDLDQEMVDSDIERIGYGHKIGEFEFRNQNNQLITQEDVSGKVYVAEYFFTTCKSICPVMNRQMQRVHEKFVSEDEFRILSYTVDPETDTVEQMKRYAVEHGANDEKWHFLTGPKEDLYSLARKSYFVLKPAEAQNLGDAGSDFIHTNNFVLVDREARIRGYYDGTSEKEVNKLMHDIDQLLKE